MRGLENSGSLAFQGRFSGEKPKEIDERVTMDMVAYEFYWRDSRDLFHLIGILPERRRKSPGRITGKSIMNWGRMVLGENADLSKLFFAQVTINEKTGEILYPQPSFRAKAEA